MRYVSHPILGLVILAAALSLTACGDKAPKNDSNVITTQSPAEADALQKEFAAQCGDAANCNPSVGLLIARLNPTQIAVCTSFLVAPDIIATNKHCLPDAVQIAGANCSGLIGFKFPGSHQASAAAAECATVIAVSPYPVTTTEGGAKAQTDYAILKLTQPLGRPVLKFDGSGIADQEHVTVVSMSPDNNERSGTISSYDCRAVQGTVSTDSYTSSFSPIVQFNDCPIIHGNSGSPAIGSSGGVKAIVMQGAVDLAAMKAAGIANPKPFGRATNFACVTEPSIGLVSNASPDCHIDLSDAAAEQRSSQELQSIITSSNAQADLIAAIEGFEKNSGPTVPLDSQTAGSDGCRSQWTGRRKILDGATLLASDQLMAPGFSQSRIKTIPRCRLFRWRAFADQIGSGL